MGVHKNNDSWRLPDELWTKLEALLPPRPEHPLGCHNPRVPDRRAMDAILLVLRTGMQWHALKATGLCHPSSAYWRFREWLKAGVFHEFWRQGLLAYDALASIDWKWLALDGALGKAPLGGEKKRPQPGRPSRAGSLLTDGRGIPLGPVAAGANTNDFKLVQQTFASVPVRRPRSTSRRRQHLCVDVGYNYDEVYRWARRFGFTLHVRHYSKHLKRSARKKPQLWVVERTHSWLHRFRRLLVRWEKREDTYVAVLHFALGLITWFHCVLPK